MTGRHIFLLCAIVLVELFARYQLRRWKHLYDFGDDEQGIDEEQYSEYYKRAQILYVVRVTLLVLFFSLVVLGVDASSFGYLAIAAGAITIVFGSYIQSFATYFYILSITSVGQTVKIGPWQGDIIKIRPLYVALTSRSDNGEHTGELVNIPNYKVWDNPIINVDLALNDYKKSILPIYFKQADWHISFDDFITELKTYLDSYLQKPVAKAVYHYKTYRGYSYKLGYDYTADGVVEVRIGFICQLKDTFSKKYAIIAFIEGLRFAGKQAQQSSEERIPDLSTDA